MGNGSNGDRQRIFTLTEAESAAIQDGDIQRYLALLTDDAVFLPPNLTAKAGEELRRWLSEFLEQVSVESLQFAHGETVIRDDLACHEYTCKWRTTPKPSGQPSVTCFKGVHVLRREPSGAWKISRNIWNTDPRDMRS